MYAFTYLFPAVGIIMILAMELARAGVMLVRTWIQMNLALLFWSTCFLVVGALLLVRPEQMLRWTVRHAPQIAGDKPVQLVARLIGVGFLAIALMMLKRL
jgi:hypothetical protein